MSDFYYLNVSVLRKLDCDYVALTNYVRQNFDASYFLSHPHQGLDGDSPFDLRYVEADLVNGLRGTKGYPPNKDQCADPTFTQVSKHGGQLDVRNVYH